MEEFYKLKGELYMYTKLFNHANLCRIFFVIADLFALNAIFLLLFSLLVPVSGPGVRNYVNLILISNMTWLISSYMSGTYLIYKNLDLKKIAKRTLFAFAVYAITDLLLVFIYNFNYNRPFILITIICFGAFLVVTRLFLIVVVLYTRTNIRFQSKAVIIGHNQLSKDLAGLFYTSHKTIKVQGYFGERDQTGDREIPFLGEISDCLPYAIEHHISEIYCTLSPEHLHDLYTLAEEAEKHFIRFRFVPDMRKFINRKVHIDFIENMPVLSLRPEPLGYRTAQLKKRIFDIAISLFIIIFILSWLLPILAILIKLDSKGPVFFTQSRSGINNCPFECYKLRTLRAHNNANGAVSQVTKNDARATRVGRILRKTNLDELPQFFNVLTGQMSIVGARPHMLKHTLDFASMDDDYMVRHLSKPGVTGWAQINGYRGEIKQSGQLKKRIEHDIWYIEHWDIWLDIKIIFMTIYVTFKGDKNAY